MKKISTVLAVILAIACFFTGCSAGTDTQNINVITREEGSGTRSAFVEIFGIESENENGEKIDNTVITAETTNSTFVMITSVAGDPNAIGYISLGSLSDSVKALKIDGVDATAENVKNGKYKISRSFNIAVKKDLSAAAQNFIDFIMSAQGQKVVEDSGYISKGNNGVYNGSLPAGTVNVAGSSSVAPVMEKLKEAYEAVNPNAKIIIQQNDSTTGITSALDGVCDIAMASRELKNSERAAGLTSFSIATDGIAVIVSLRNPVNSLTSNEVKAIYTGKRTEW